VFNQAASWVFQFTIGLLCMTSSSFIFTQDANFLSSTQTVPEVEDANVEEAKETEIFDSDLPDRAEELLNFWFGYLPGPDYIPEDKISIWFSEAPRAESILRKRFSQDVARARNGDYNSWRRTAAGRLALILLLDRIPRQIYRDRAQAFASDPMARALVIEGIQEHQDEWLYPIERAFFYLPLEHAEDTEIQRISVEAYSQLLNESPSNLKPFIRMFYDYALVHQQQIEQFGRFPARNAILNRESTPAELEFLKSKERPK
jgi:uncharacterized protein (DUF924 family)